MSRKGELRAHRVVDLARAGLLGQHLRVDRRELDREERDPERDQQRRGHRGDPPRDPHHEARQPVPEPGARGPGVRLGAALEERRSERVHAPPQQRQDRRQHDQRDRRRDQRDQRAAEAHRVEEVLREDEQRGESSGNGERREQDRASRRGQGAAHRFETGPRARDLLAIARDDEEAVVDRQPEPEARNEVDREDRDVGQLVGDPQHQERADDRQHTDDQGQQRGHEAAEEEQREQEQEREGEHLRPSEVLLDLLVDLLLGDRGAANGHAGLAGERFGDPLGCVLAPVVLGRRQAHAEVRRLAVLGDEVLRSGVEISDHLFDVLALRQLVGDLADALAPVGRRDVDVLDQDADVAGAVARVLEQLLRLGALGVGVGGVVGDQAVGDAAPERAGGEEEDDGSGHDPASAALGECGEAVEHHAALRLRVRAALSSSRSTRSHHSIIHSLYSIPWRRTMYG